MSVKQMILILLIAFFVLGCSFSCNGVKENFITYDCKQKLTNDNLCDLLNEQNANISQDDFIKAVSNAAGSTCNQSDQYYIGSIVRNLWSKKDDC